MLGSVKVSRVSFRVSVSISVSISLPRLIWYEDIFFSLLTDSRWKDYISSFFQKTFICAGCVSKGMRAVKLCTNKILLLFNWRCWLTEVELYNGRKTVVVLFIKASRFLLTTAMLNVIRPIPQSHR